ncbi:MAG TPA: thiamine phosphate synthase [Cytophagaceae bacterium]|jgi:thiamine-phosphate pyrophosphorylase|nr:thiamine phosphate synthase [Cytophagaceae bacterium]
MNISKLHYITQEIEGKSHYELVEEACIAGVDWVQLRIKDKSQEEILSMAYKVKELCNNYHVKLILNDHVAIAKKIQADGVHVGKLDMDPKEVREITGQNFIIGGTANTMEDIKKLTAAKVDYIGLGPFRFTTTKDNLSPVLGLDGYRDLMAQCVKEKIKIPIIAIGGIVPEDVIKILETGIYGVAVSGAINKAIDKRKVVESFLVGMNRYKASAVI